MHIRPAEKRDLKALETLWVRFMEEQGRFDARVLPADDAPARWRNDAPEWIDRGGRRMWVAEEGGLVGFVTAHPWAPPPVYASPPGLFIDELYVHPDARRRGVGRALVAAVLAWADDLGTGPLRLHVLEANEAGRAFWASVGAVAFARTLEIPHTADERDPAPRRGKLGFRETPGDAGG